jgi:hypothetical protein
MLFSSPKTYQTNISVIRTPMIVIFLLVRTSRIVTHPITSPSWAHLILKFFWGRLPKKAYHVCITTLSILLKRGPRYQNPPCWGPSASEGPQKHDLIMFSKWNMWTGIFGIGLWICKSMVRTKLEWDGRRLWRRIRWSRSYAQKSFGMTAEKGNRLKDEKAD